MKTKSKVFKVLCLFLSIILLGSFAILPIQALDTGVAPPPTRYSTIRSMSHQITISGTSATCVAELTAYYSTNLSIVMELQKYESSGYATIKTWSDYTTGTFLAMNESRLINLLSSYRLRVTFTAGGETSVQYDYP